MQIVICACIRRRLVIDVLFLLVILAGAASSAIRLQTVAKGLSAPVYVTAARGGGGRLFIVEQRGRIVVVSDGRLLVTPFLDISDRVASGGELGLVGLAFHPSYAKNRRFFVNYTRAGSTPSGLQTVVAEYTASPTNPNVADKASERIVLSFAQPTPIHNGGMLSFGPDGYLYISTGDGGPPGDPQGNAQNLDLLLGKILRIHIDAGRTGYSVPRDNPFVGKPGRDEIWAYGFRNPFRFSFDRATGRLIAGDVGEGNREEVDLVQKGGNYGWNRMEATLCFSPPVNCSAAGLIPPIHSYARQVGQAVTGGYIYRGPSAPPLLGKYIFADYSAGWIAALTEVAPGQWAREELVATRKLFSLSSFGEGENGDLYVVDYSAGAVRRIISAPVMEIELSKASYSNGEVVSAPIYRLSNPGPVPVAVELKVWLKGPGIGPLPMVNAGSDGSYVLPARFNQNMGPVSPFQVTADLPRGTYEFSSRMRDPTTGELLSEDLNSFTIVP